MSRPRSRIRYELMAAAAPARLAPRAVPSVDPWAAGEMFVSVHAEERRRGFALLVGSEAVRRSALTAQLLAARVHEPDLALRAQIVQALADFFEVRGGEHRYPAEVRAAAAGHLRRFDRGEVLALLELHPAGCGPAARLAPDALDRLCSRIPTACGHLVRAAGDRTLPAPLRCAALELIGRVGFTDAQPALEGLEARLAGRRAGQIAMAFAPSDSAEEEGLLPAVRAALDALRDDA